MAILEEEMPQSGEDEKPVSPAKDNENNFADLPDLSKVQPTGLEMISSLHGIFAGSDEDDDEDDNSDEDDLDDLSATMIMLRCIGHIAAGTIDEIPETDEAPPPVNPWKLAKGIAKATVNKEVRRVMIDRIKQEFSIGDMMGIAVVALVYKGYRDQGLDEDEAKKRSWEYYMKLGPKDSKL